MKAAIITDSTFPESTSTFLSTLRAGLKGLGIHYERFTAPVAPSAATLSSDFDFIILPRPRSAEFMATIDSVNLTIPVFAMNCDSIGASQISATSGVTGSPKSRIDQYISVPWSTSVWYAAFTKSFVLSTGTSFMTVQATNPRDDVAQTNAGDTVGWYNSKAGAGNLYASAVNVDTQPLLAIFLQVAIVAGDFTAAQISSLNKLPLSIDMDHVSGSSWNTDKDIFDRWADLIPGGGVSWSGAANSAASATANIDNLIASIVSVLSAETNKRMKFSYHEHFNTAVTGVWPTQVDARTKVQQDASYSVLKTAWEAQGLTLQSSGGFYVPADNAWNEETLQLLSEQSSLASDPLNATPQVGYGLKMVRYATSNQCSRPAPDIANYPRNVLRQREYMRGMTLIPCKDYAAANSIVTTSKWRAQFQLFLQAVHCSTSLYFHDEDFKDTQDPKTAEFGVEIMQQLVDFNDYMVDTVKVFADMTEYSV